MRRKKARNGLGFLDPVSLTAIAAGVSALVPVVTGLFTKSETKASDPNAYSKDLQAAIALKTQAAIAAQQTQAVQAQAQSAVQVEQIKSDSTKRLLLYGAGAVVAVVGAIILFRSLKRRD
jgi:hypothetical protein